MSLTIEQMRKIVDEAPKYSQVAIPCLDGCMYFAQREDGTWFKYSDGYQKWLEYFGSCDPMDLAFKLDDLKSKIKQFDNHTDYVTDIRNHISPMTIVRGE